MPKEKKDSNLNERENKKEEETPIIEEDNDKIVVADNKENTAKKYWWVWMIIAILVVAAIVLACVYGCQPNDNNDDETTLVEPGVGGESDFSSETKTDEQEGTIEESGDTSGDEGSDSGGTSGEEESGDDDSSSEDTGSGSGGTSEDEGSGSGGTSEDEGSGSGGTSGDEESGDDDSSSEDTGSGSGGTSEDEGSGSGGTSGDEGSGSGSGGSGSGSGSSDDDDENDDEPNTGMSVDDVLSYIDSIDTNSIATWSCLSGHYETESEDDQYTYDIAITYNEDGYIYGYDMLMVTDSESSDYTITYNYYTGTETYTYVYTYSNTTGSGDSEFSYTPTITLEETTYSEYLSSNTISTLSSVLTDITTTITSDNDALIDVSLNEGLEITTFSVTYYGSDGYQYKIDVDSDSQNDESVVTTYTITTYSGEETISIITYSLITYDELKQEDWTSDYESELADAKAAYEQETYLEIIESFVSSYTQTSSLTENWEGISYITDTSTVVVTTNEDGNLYGYTETTANGETTYIYYGEDGVYTKVDTTYTYSEETDDTYSQFTYQAESDYLIEYVSGLVNTITSSGAAINDVTLEDDYTLEVSYTTNDTTYKVTIVKDSDTGDLSSFSLETTTYEDGVVSGTTNVSINALTCEEVTTPDWYTSDQENFEAAKGEYEEEKEAERVQDLLDSISYFLNQIVNIDSSTNLESTWEGLSVVSYSENGSTTILLTDDNGNLYGYKQEESNGSLINGIYYSEDGYTYTKVYDDGNYTYTDGKTTTTYSDSIESTYTEYIYTYVCSLLSTLEDSSTTLIDATINETSLIVTYSIGESIYQETLVIDDSNNLTSLTLEESRDGGNSYSTVFVVETTTTDSVSKPSWFDESDYYGQTSMATSELSDYLASSNLESVYSWEALYIYNIGSTTYNYIDYLSENGDYLYGYQLAWQEKNDSGTYTEYHETYYVDTTQYIRYTNVYADESTDVTQVSTTTNVAADMYTLQLGQAYSEIQTVLTILADDTTSSGEITNTTIDHEKEYDLLSITYNDKNGLEHVLELTLDEDGNILSIKQYTDTSYLEYSAITKEDIVFPDYYDPSYWTEEETSKKAINSVMEAYLYLANINIEYVYTWTGLDTYQNYGSLSYDSIYTTDGEGNLIGYQLTKSYTGGTNSRGCYANCYYYLQYLDSDGNPTNGTSASDVVNGPYTEIKNMYTSYINAAYDVITSELNAATENLATYGLINGTIEENSSEIIYTIVCSTGSQYVQLILKTDLENNLTYFEETTYKSKNYDEISTVFRYSQDYQENFNYADYGFDTNTLTWN